MTLTEEQREAIRAVSDLPRAIGCTQCHSYIQEHYGNQFAILRAMIDSSGTVEPTGGFDLEKARAADEALPYPLDANEIWVSGKGQMHINPPNAPSIFFTLSDLCEFRNLFHGQAAEIERLRADLEQSERVIEARLDVIDQQAARIKSLKKEIRRLKHESKVEQEFTNSYIKRLHDAEARIKELGSSLDEAEALTKKNAELMNGYLRRIAELEDALVEGLTNFLHYRASCYDPARRCPYAKECDDCSTWDACGHVEMFRSEARRQLQAEGKIGPDAKPRVWQITEERKETLRRALEEYKIFPNDQAVLRAMLQEAGL